jgi:hypothetical protein
MECVRASTRFFAPQQGVRSMARVLKAPPIRRKRLHSSCACVRQVPTRTHTTQALAPPSLHLLCCNACSSGLGSTPWDVAPSWRDSGPPCGSSGSCSHGAWPGARRRGAPLTRPTRCVFGLCVFFFSRLVCACCALARAQRRARASPGARIDPPDARPRHRCPCHRVFSATHTTLGRVRAGCCAMGRERRRRRRIRLRVRRHFRVPRSRRRV